MKNLKWIILCFWGFLVAGANAQTMSGDTLYFELDVDVPLAKTKLAKCGMTLAEYEGGGYGVFPIRTQNDLKKTKKTIIKSATIVKIKRRSKPSNDNGKMRDTIYVERVKHDTITITVPTANPMPPTKPTHSTSDSKYDPAFDIFLNIEDETIFTTKFIKKDIEKIPLRSVNYYSMICDIRSLNSTLEKLEKATNQQGKNREELDSEFLDLLDKISFYPEKVYLTESQNKYVQDIVKRYNDLHP